MSMLFHSPGRQKQLLLLVCLLWLPACASGPQSGLDNEYRIFSPDPLVPLRVAITSPLESDTFAGGHQLLTPWSDSGAQRRKLMSCTWGEGLNGFVQGMVPGTEIIYLGLGRDPLTAVGSGIVAETDSLGETRFSFDGPATVDVARHLGWTHLVVPLNLEPGWDEKKDLGVLATAVAIIDVQERRLVWQGKLDSGNIPEKNLGRNTSDQPALTPYESAVYRFVLDLCRLMERHLNPKPDSRHQWAAPCQDPPPLMETSCNGNQVSKG